jgi:hypothetical protein
MNDKEIFKKVGAILSEINDQYQYLSRSPGSVNEFEIELMLANAKFLGDHVEILQRYYHSAAVSANEVKEPQPGPAPAVPEKEPESIPTVVPTRRKKKLSRLLDLDRKNSNRLLRKQRRNRRINPKNRFTNPRRLHRQHLLLVNP